MGIVSKNEEPLELGFLFLGQLWLVLDGVIGVEKPLGMISHLLDHVLGRVVEVWLRGPIEDGERGCKRGQERGAPEKVEALCEPRHGPERFGDKGFQ